MLVLGREIGEGVVLIGSDGVIRISLERKNGNLRFVIKAPPKVRIVREEIYDEADPLPPETPPKRS